MARTITKDDVQGMTKVETDFFKPEEEGDGFVGVPIGTTQTQHGTAVKVDTEEQGILLVNQVDINEFLEDRIGRKKVTVAFRGKEPTESGNKVNRFDTWEEDVDK